MAKKSRKNDTVQIDMITAATPEDAALSELMSMLNADPAAVDSTDEVIEATAPELPVFDPTAEVPIPAPAATHDELTAAVAAAESVESMIAAATPDVPDGSVSGDDSDVSAATPEGGAKPKKERTPRKHYTNKAERIKDRLGEALPEYVSALTLDDAAKLDSEEAVTTATAETMTLIAGMSKKKQNRAGFLLEFVSGKKDKLNAVMKLALTVLNRDGYLTTGKEGNYLAALLAVPYSPAAARAMGGNTVAVFEDLKLITPDGKGRFIANPDSLLLAKVNSMLGFGADEGESPDAGEFDPGTAALEASHVEETAAA